MLRNVKVSRHIRPIVTRQRESKNSLAVLVGKVSIFVSQEVPA
jgi:hypothetical protein